MKRINLIGKTFGHLTVEAHDLEDVRYWLCRCECGNSSRVRGDHLRYGKIVSCGIQCQVHYHGLSKTRAFPAWVKMRIRCNDADCERHYRYGGRGISYCDRWESFQNFYDDMGECPPGYQLERINNDGNYEPGNCRWASRKEQANNKSTNRFVWFNGRQMTLAQACEISGVNYKTAHTRLSRGWTDDRAVALEA